MTHALSLHTLVLNADYKPLSTWPLSLIPATDAVRAVYQDKAAVVEEWDEAFHSPSTTIRVPKVMALRDYVSIASTPKFCRRSVLLRDGYCCQYCGNQFASEDLTFDHVIPRAHGGKTVWENILMACERCNTAKAASMPKFSGGARGRGDIRPLKAPRCPTTAELMRAGLKFLDSYQQETWGDYLYWNARLEP